MTQTQPQRSSSPKYSIDDIGYYAKAGVDSKGSLRNGTTQLGSFTPDQIRNLLQSSTTQYAQIGSLMEALYQRNGIVNRTLGYYTAISPFRHNIYPALNSKNNFAQPTDVNDYLTAAELLEKYNMRFFAPYSMLRTLIQGMSFYYEVADNTGVSYFEFPLEVGKISAIENGVYRWMIDTSRLKQELKDLDGFPNEIKKAMEATDKTDPKKWSEGKYYKLSNKAFAICFDPSVIKNGGVAISEFASLLTESSMVERAKENVDIKDDIDTVRIIHGKIPMDKEGNPKMNPANVETWREVLTAGLPPGIQAVVSPFELGNISLGNAGTTKAYDTVDDAQSQLFYATGTPSPMFGGDTNSYNIAKMSTIKDAGWVYAKVLPVYTSYYNDIMSRMKTSSGVTWKVRILEQSIFTLDESIKLYKDAVTIGGSRTDYLASTGMSPLEIYSKLNMEQSLFNIDSWMVPKQTSFTMSGSASESEAGRPVTDSPTDDTDRIEN